MSLKAIIVALVGASSVGAFADVTGGVSLGDFLLTRSPATAPSMKLEYSLASEVDFDSAAGGFSYERVKADVPLSAPYHLNDRHMFTLEASYGVTWLQTDTFLGDMDLHDFRLRLRWMHRQPGSKWSWMTVLSPGLATDAEGLDGDDFSLNGQVGFRYSKSPRFAWIGGVVFFVNSMETRVYPGVGFQWRPTDEVLINLTGPSLRVFWQPHEDWIFSTVVSSGGGTWNVENSGASFDVKLRSYQAAVGVERRLSEKVWLGLWGGATFANDLEIETATGNRLFNQSADTGWFVRLGIRKVLW